MARDNQSVAGLCGVALLSALAVGSGPEGPASEAWRVPEPTQLERQHDNARAGMALGGVALGAGTLVAVPSAFGPRSSAKSAALGSGLALAATGVALMTAFGARERRLRLERWALLGPAERWQAREAQLRGRVWAGLGLASGGTTLMVLGMLVVGGEFEWMVPLASGAALAGSGLGLAIGSGIAHARHQRRSGGRTFSLRAGPGSLQLRF